MFHLSMSLSLSLFLEITHLLHHKHIYDVLIRYEEPDQDVVEMRDWFDDDGGVGGELEHSQDSPILAVLRKKVEQGLISQAEYVCPHAHQNLLLV